MVYADTMRTALTGRAGDWLARHSWPRITMVAVFSLSAWAAYQCSNWIAGWGGFATRFSISFLAGYAVFVLCLVCWLWIRPSLDQVALLDGAPDSIETINPWGEEATEAREQFLDGARRSAEHQARADGAQGLIGLAVAAIIVGTLFVVLHMVWYARWYLGRLLLLGGKVRHRTLENQQAFSYLAAPVQITIWAAVILLVHYALLGLILQWAFPQAVTIADIVRRMRP